MNPCTADNSDYFDSCPGGSSPKTACPGGKFVGTTGSGQLSDCDVSVPPPPKKNQLKNYHFTQTHKHPHNNGKLSSILLAEALTSFDWFTFHRTHM